eukprot:9316233-Alexandrium_andersonii.AAC.1
MNSEVALAAPADDAEDDLSRFVAASISAPLIGLGPAADALPQDLDAAFCSPLQPEPVLELAGPGGGGAALGGDVEEAD